MARLRSVLAMCMLSVLIAPLVAAAPPSRAAGEVLVTLADDGASFAREHGGRVVGPGIVAVPADAAARDARVLSAEPDSPVRSTDVQAQTASWNTASWNTASWNTASWNTASWNTASWNVASTPDGALDPNWGARALHANVSLLSGTPALVCVVDSGIDVAHPQLADALWHDAAGHVGIDLVRHDDQPDDEAGHGTHLAGIIAAGNGGPMHGISNARIASAKILDANGVGTTSDLIAALNWCVGIRADVILLALSEDSPTSALAKALRAAARDGRVIVAAAGNDGPCRGCVTYPASDPHVTAIASLDPSLAPSNFSAAGRAVDLALPGRDIASTFVGGSWRVGSGTSQAAAFAAGAVAAVKAARGYDSASDALDRLERTARDLGAPGKDDATGFGIPDLARAAQGGR